MSCPRRVHSIVFRAPREGLASRVEPRLRSGAAAAFPSAHMHVCCTGHLVDVQPMIWALSLESELSLRQATWIAGCPDAQRMRVEALGYRAAHAAHQEVMRSGLKDGRGMRGSPLRFVPRSQLCGHVARSLVCMKWLVSAHSGGPGLFSLSCRVGGLGSKGTRCYRILAPRPVAAWPSHSTYQL